MIANRTRRFGAALVAAVSAFSAHGLTQQRPGTFVAVVRSDGSMIPLAAFDGEQWWNHWPAESNDEGDQPPLPASLADVPADWLPPGMPLPVEWRLSLGGSMRPIRALRPIRTEMLEQHVTGLQTDYQWKDRLNEADTAVAVSGPATVGRFVTAPARETNAVTRQLAARLATLEQQEIARWIKETDRPIDTAKRLTRVYRDGDRNAPVFSMNRAEQPFEGKTYYHFTGEKLYAEAPGGIDSCKMNMSFDGVVSTDRSGRVTSQNVTAFAYAEYCGDAAAWSHPIATVSIGGQYFWVTTDGVEDGFSYSITSPLDNRPLTLRSKDVRQQRRSVSRGRTRHRPDRMRRWLGPAVRRKNSQTNHRRS
jgi:hypothetical protein